jgi:hypothetical protein
LECEGYLFLPAFCVGVRHGELVSEPCNEKGTIIKMAIHPPFLIEKHPQIPTTHTRFVGLDYEIYNLPTIDNLSRN